MAKNDWTYWNDALLGRRPPIHADDPQAGFYRLRRGKKWLPAAIWRGANPVDGGASSTWLAKVGHDAADPYEIWTWCADKPITRQEYDHWMEHGRWPGEPPEQERRIGVGHNAPPDDAAILSEEIAHEVEAAKAWLQEVGEIKRQTDADMAANWAARLAKLAKSADEERKREKQPHLDACRAVDAKWRDIIDAPKRLAKALKDALTPYLAAQREKAAEEARNALESGGKRVSANPAAGGHEGRKVHLRTIVRAEIMDYEAVLRHYAEHPDVRALIQRLADADAKEGLEISGIKIVREEKAV